MTLGQEVTAIFAAIGMFVMFVFTAWVAGFLWVKLAMKPRNIAIRWLVEQAKLLRADALVFRDGKIVAFEQDQELPPPNSYLGAAAASIPATPPGQPASSIPAGHPLTVTGGDPTPPPGNRLLSFEEIRRAQQLRAFTNGGDPVAQPGDAPGTPTIPGPPPIPDQIRVDLLNVPSFLYSNVRGAGGVPFGSRQEYFSRIIGTDTSGAGVTSVFPIVEVQFPAAIFSREETIGLRRTRIVRVLADQSHWILRNEANARNREGWVRIGDTEAADDWSHPYQARQRQLEQLQMEINHWRTFHGDPVQAAMEPAGGTGAMAGMMGLPMPVNFEPIGGAPVPDPNPGSAREDIRADIQARLTGTFPERPPTEAPSAAQRQRNDEIEAVVVFLAQMRAAAPVEDNDLVTSVEEVLAELRRMPLETNTDVLFAPLEGIVHLWYERMMKRREKPVDYSLPDRFT